MERYTIDEFAAGIKKKHPEYKEWDNKELVLSIAKKYPEYAEMIDFGQVAGFEQRVQEAAAPAKPPFVQP